MSSWALDSATTIAASDRFKKRPMVNWALLNNLLLVKMATGKLSRGRHRAWGANPQAATQTRLGDSEALEWHGAAGVV